jgi:putative membrane protein
MVEYDPHGWWAHFLDIRGSMVREIGPRVLGCTLWAALAVWFHSAVHPVDIPGTVHSLAGLAVGLLLVFRTNASYDRFWEGRKLWGGIVNEARNLARGARALLERDAELMAGVIRWTASFPWAAMHLLRGERGLGPAGASLPEPDVRAMLTATHVPLAISVKLTRLVAEARRRGVISDQVQVSLDHNIQLLVDYVGACERIQRTPLPFAYVVHLRRALLLYCLTLPFVLIRDFAWGTVPATFIAAYVFLGIEEIGVEIENPFGEDDNDLPLERICAAVEANLKGLLDSGDTGASAPPAAASAARPPPA